MAGRALRYHMHPLTIQEMGNSFDVAKVLQFGLLPKAVTIESPKKYLDSYVQSYVREEVLQESLTRNIAAFSRFLEAASFSQGQTLNYTEIGKEIHVHRLVVAAYFDILDDLLLAVRIPPFTKRAKRKLIMSDKFFFFDVGVYKNLRPKGPFDTPEELDGAGLETLFLQHVRALNDYYDLDYKIYFWRTESKLEVDFVLYGPHGIHAFEIKRSKDVTNNMLKGLRAFQQDYPEAKLHFLHGSHLKTYHDKITAYPFVEALQLLPDLLKG